MINAISKNLLSFIKNSPSPFHSVASIKKVLKREGFIELNESELNDNYSNDYFFAIIPVNAHSVNAS